MKKQKADPIKNKKKRGEWVELKFMAEAAERNLPASKPLGDSEHFDVVVGRTGKFVGVQIKSVTHRSANGEGYLAPVRNSKGPYPAGAFDFIAVYVVPENVWYILPAKEILGMRSVSLCTPACRWEKYREAWKSLQEAVGLTQEESSQIEESIAPNRMESRMMGAFNSVRRHWER